MSKKVEPKEFDTVGDHGVWVYDVGYGHRDVSATHKSDHLYFVKQDGGFITIAGIVDDVRIPRIELSKKVVMALLGSVLRSHIAELLGIS